MNKELKFNVIFDKNGNDFSKLIVDAILNYLKSINNKGDIY